MYCYWDSRHPYNNPQPKPIVKAEKYISINLSRLPKHHKQSAWLWLQQNMPGFADLLKSEMRGNRRQSDVIIEILEAALPGWARDQISRSPGSILQ